MPITNCGVIGYWRGVIVSNGGFIPFLAHSTFSFKHGVAPLPKRGNVHRNWAFELVLCRSLHSRVKCLGLDYLGPHLYLELKRRVQLTHRDKKKFVKYKSSIHNGPKKILDKHDEHHIIGAIRSITLWDRDSARLMCIRALDADSQHSSITY